MKTSQLVLLAMLGVFAVARGGFTRCRAEYVCTGAAVNVDGITNTAAKQEIGACKNLASNVYYCRLDTILLSTGIPAYLYIDETSTTDSIVVTGTGNVGGSCIFKQDGTSGTSMNVGDSHTVGAATCTIISAKSTIVI